MKGDRARGPRADRAGDNLGRDASFPGIMAPGNLCETRQR